VRKDHGLACVDRLAREQKRAKVTAPTKTYSLLGITKGRTVHVESSLIDEVAETVPSSPNLTRRLLLVTLVTVVVVSLLAIALPTPLEEAANPRVTPNPAKAPWYFLWLQELVTDTTIHLGGFTISGAFIGGILIPGLVVAALVAWPFLDRSPVSAVGVWFAAVRHRQNTVFLLLVLAVIALTIVGTFLRGPYWHFFWPWEAWPETPRHF
jgi:quinol-cytochrome oxidoreductase complex cytochrome b subunit